MKLLHSKAAAEPILAVSACPCANLFGFVTRSAVTVYRSTTLTTVFALPLKDYLGADSAPGCPPVRGNDDSGSDAYKCCWSPSGRLFTVALPNGMILVFDVEGGTLARVFYTRAHSPPSPRTASAAPWVETSLPLHRPVLAMAWCAVPSRSSARIAAMATDVQTRCLPVRLGVTSALCDEATQQTGSGTDGAPPPPLPLFDWRSNGGAELPSGGFGGDYDKDANVAGGDAGRRGCGTTTSVSMLLVLGCDGRLRCFVGGLYEASATSLTLPDSLAQQHHDASPWEWVRVRDVQVRQCAVDPRTGQEPAAATGAKAPTWAASTAFGETAADPVQPAVEQHHRLYFTVKDARPAQPLHDDTTNTSGNTSVGGESALSAAGLPSQALWEVGLQDRLTTLATPRWIALAFVREYTRAAQETFTALAVQWSSLVRGRVCAHLGLPAAGPLLSSALLAQLTDPDPILLYKYAKHTLKRAELAEDLEAMAKLFRTLVYDVTHVCYRCVEAAMVYAAHAGANAVSVPSLLDAEPAITGGRGSTEEPQGLRLSSIHATLVSSSAATGFVDQLGALRRQYERFLAQAAQESECARDLALWVGQQAVNWESGTRFTTGGYGGAAAAAGYGEDDRPSAAPTGGRGGSPVPLQPPPQQPVLIDEVPVSATRQPALLDFLTDLSRGLGTTLSETSAFCPPPRTEATVEEESTRLYAEIMAAAEAHSTRSGTGNSTALCCRVVSGVSNSDTAAPSQSQLLSCVVVDDDEAEDDDENNDSSAESSEGNDEQGSVLANSVGSDDEPPHRQEEDEDGHCNPFTDNDRYDGAMGSAGAQRVASQSARVFALLCSAHGSRGAVQPMHLSAARLALSSTSVLAQDEEATETDRTATLGTQPSELFPLHSADVDTVAMRTHLNADFFKDSSVAYSSSWFGWLEDDRHVLLCQPSSVLSRSAGPDGAAGGAPAKLAAPFFIAVVQDDGTLVVAEEREGDDEENEEGGSSRGGGGGDGDGEAGESDGEAESGDDAPAARVALCQVTGMEGVPLRVSMSRSRSFCVVVGVTKYVVVSLYDDEY